MACMYSMNAIGIIGIVLPGIQAVNIIFEPCTNYIKQMYW